jgi:hypothetical protein
MTGQSTPPLLTVIELRQYTLHPGQRDVMIALFEREFIESQEALGMQVLGTFRDLDKPDRFVWIRGFTDMTARANALEAFYDGPVWRAHPYPGHSTGRLSHRAKEFVATHLSPRLCLNRGMQSTADLPGGHSTTMTS